MLPRLYYTISYKYLMGFRNSDHQENENGQLKRRREHLEDNIQDQAIGGTASSNKSNNLSGSFGGNLNESDRGGNTPSKPYPQDYS